MNFNLIITLLVMVFMIVSFVIQKWSYGLTAMTCVVVLTLAGVIDVQTAFSGFSNTTTILIATMIVIAGQLSRTSLISRIRSLMTKAQDKGGILLILLICAFTALLTQLMGMTAVPTAGSILISFSVSVGIGLLFGYMPASRAARLNPIDALRSE